MFTKIVSLIGLVFFVGLAQAATTARAETDLETTRRLRQAIVTQSDLSTEALNIHIVVLSGKVILTGPVTSLKEKEKLSDIAHTVIGRDAEIDNELTIIRKVAR